MTGYYAAENVAKPGGKVHRVRGDDDTATTLCGITTVGAWAFSVADQLADGEVGCLRCWRPRPDPEPTEFPTAESVVDLLIDTEVARAVDCYAHGMPGHGEYVLVRLGMRLARLERVVDEARDVLHRA